MDYPNLCQSQIGTISAHLTDNDSQQTAFERTGIDECESLNQSSSIKEDEKSVDKMETLSHFKPLSSVEKRFLLAVERGDLPAVKRLIRESLPDRLNINCCDPLGRSGLVMAIDNENLEMIELLISAGIEMKDALLHAINEEFVEAVELLLDQENLIHIPDSPHSWETTECETFTSDITPLVLAAHRNNYEIIKILLDRNVSPIPTPHDSRCGCKQCCAASKKDCLRHSRSRINAYKALSSPSLIALSSKDPILTAFELSWQLRRLSFLEPEFKSEYLELRKQCQVFATALLDHTRTTDELELLLNYDSNGDPLENHERMQLSRLKLAIQVKQKMFCAHANVQQLLASIWYEGLPGFRRRNIVFQTLQLIGIGLSFPILSLGYILFPSSSLGKFIKKPFIKFICHSASYVTFLVLLMLASQRIENDIFGSSPLPNVEANLSKRGALPSSIELCILAWVFGLIWSEIKQLWDLGISEYLSDMWNILDFINNSLYVATITLRFIAYNRTQTEIQSGLTTYAYQRELWDDYDPILLSEGLFATANIFSSLKLVYIFSVNPYLGPLQISLGRMVIDILKFFSIYTLVLFSFACGMNQLLWYYADMEKQTCVVQLNKGLFVNGTLPENFSKHSLMSETLHPDACFIWRRFANLFESTQTLFWATFGLIDLNNFELTGIKSYTRFWGLLMFGVYCIINVAVLLNLLIAMMNHSYQLISEQSDKEWKFARSKLWLSYFSNGATVPPPFNILPTPKSLTYILSSLTRFCFGQTKKAKNEAMRTIRRKQRKANERDYKYQVVMRSLIRRYIMNEQRIQERQRSVTEDDCNEIKQDVNALRYELLEMLGARSKDHDLNGSCHFGRKSRQRERRLLKGFNFDFLMMDRVASFEEDYEFNDDGSTTNTRNKSPTSSSSRNKFARIAHGLANKRRGAKWRQLIEATRNKMIPFSRSQDSINSEAIGVEATNSDSNRHIPADCSPIMKLDASLRRQIYALKLDSVSLSQPALQSCAVSAALASAKPTTSMADVGCSTISNDNNNNNGRDTNKPNKAPLKTELSKSTSNESTLKQINTKVVGNQSILPYDIIVMKKDDWI
ncbi:hypothetical protein RDWZM_001143 [Blomia tropicalis]|uniref:Transient receptor ion channel domain-containing protein n=1 Tax=Blomia tropicalis TaxID=40697 RepID=A0A9Q0MC98_BLOTA|nr:hypothetical protein RDWZM_001143 [Blomia tropicalis]